MKSLATLLLGSSCAHDRGTLAWSASTEAVPGRRRAEAGVGAKAKQEWTELRGIPGASGLVFYVLRRTRWWACVASELLNAVGNL